LFTVYVVAQIAVVVVVVKKVFVKYLSLL